MYASIVRTVMLYLLIIAGLRIMGKRQIGELQPSELVVTILISNIATLPIEDVNVPLLGSVVPILTIVCFEVFLSGLTMYSKKARRLFCGSPKMVIRDGKIMQQTLWDLRFSVDDLTEQLRTAGYFDINEVQFAVVETTGNLSVYPKFTARPATAGDLGLSKEAYISAPPVVLINNGHPVAEAYQYCGITHAWLDEVLKKERLRPQDIYLMTCDRNLSYQIVRKEKG